MPKQGLYANIHKKRKRIESQKKRKKSNKSVKVEKMRKPGSKGAPAIGVFKSIKNKRK